MHSKSNNIITGKKLGEGNRVLIMIHGRGASAEDILSLAAYFELSDYTLIAPQANNHTWYPQSFLAVPAANEPYLSSALQMLRDTVDEIVSHGITSSQIYFLGFSQGACLTLEFVTRNADKYGGVIAFTGGLIGDKVYIENYSGDFGGTPVFMGCSDKDPHVPEERVHASADQLKKMNADVTVKIYPNMGHTINQDEIRMAETLIFKK